MTPAPFNPFANSSWWHLDKHLLEVWRRPTTFISECKISSGFPRLYDKKLPDSKPSPSDMAAAAVASSFSLEGEPWVEMTFTSTTEEVSKSHWLKGCWAVSPARQPGQEGLSWQCRMHLISLMQATLVWYQDSITQKAWRVLHFFPRKSIVSPFNMIRGAFHCTE